MRSAPLLLLVCTFILNNAFSQNQGIRGVILNEERKAVASVGVLSGSGKGTRTDESGFYKLALPAGRTVIINISHLGYEKVIFHVRLKEGQWLEINPVLNDRVEQISEVIISSEEPSEFRGVTVLSPETIRNIPGANAGVENLLKSLPGVSSNNELSTQYSVRGGNYDENLVYVNEVEVYRPFLIRSGQQEGLSFVNPDLVRNVHFSAGGFQAKYGDKLSSVLDITYKRPVDFSASVDLSLLGAAASVAGVSSDRKLTAITGIRYRDNSLLVDARQTETNFTPRFADIQSYLTYQFSDKFELGFLGNIAVNDYNYQPVTRQTNFGTLQQPMTLQIFYNGQEKDLYETWFGALKASYSLNRHYTAKLIASLYNTREEEYFDILAQYRLGRMNAEIGGTDFGNVEFAEGIGAQLSHARNKLDALILNLEHRGNIRIGDHQVDYGIKLTHEDIRDRIREYEVIDSAGFQLRPPLPHFANHQPYEPFEAPLEPYNSIRAENLSEINRLSAFMQWSKRANPGPHEIWFNAGIRSHTWSVDGNDSSSGIRTVVSPRLQFAIKPNWETEMLFRLAGGLYYQPPFYRELRDFSGKVNPEVKAQKALHLVVGNEYSFKLWKRPFKLISEAYYKNLDNVNSYTLENVRIRYSATNTAEAYAYGLDLRLNGEFVAGTESWLSLGYLKTEESNNDREYIPRPTDQRLKFGVLFQDYVPSIPDLKLYLNMVYNTGLPGGSPSYADPYNYQSRLPDYKRADIGFSYLLKAPGQPKEGLPWLRPLKEASIGLEIFNLFDTQNSITNTFVRDVYSKRMYAVPNYLTPRIYNIRIGIKY